MGIFQLKKCDDRWLLSGQSNHQKHPFSNNNGRSNNYCNSKSKSNNSNNNRLEDHNSPKPHIPGQA